MKNSIHSSVQSFAIPQHSYRGLLRSVLVFSLMFTCCGMLADSNPDSMKASLPTKAAVISSYAPDQYMKTVATLFAGEKFAELDSMAATARTNRTRFHGGGWELHTLYVTISSPAGSGGNDTLNADWQLLEQKLKRWMAQRPDSITPRIALAGAYRLSAWQARGDGYADLVKDEAWGIFGERQRLALTVLNDAVLLKEKCPEWYTLMINTSRDQSWDPSGRKALLEQAIAFEPLYYYNYKDFAFSLQPRWGGEVGEAEEFARQIADRIGGKQGQFIYFQIAIELSCTGCAEDKTQFSRLSWKTIQQGYAALEEMYGTSPYFLNEFAHLAVRAEDRDVAIKTFLQIGNDWREDVWHSRQYFESSKGWALAPPPEFMEHWAAAMTNFHTPIGRAYQGKIDLEFEKDVAAAVKACETGQKSSEGPFGLTLLMGKDGMLEQAKAWPPTSASACLLSKLNAHRFTAPPSGSYWIVHNVGEVKPPPFHFEAPVIPDVRN